MTAPKPTLEVAISTELEALWRYAWRLTGHEEDAADLVQRTCLRALEQRHHYKEQGKARSWLFSLEHRIWLNEVRARQIRTHRSFNTVTSSVEHFDGTDSAANRSEGKASSDVEPENNLFMNQIVEAVEALPEAQRHVMLLACVEGFSYREVADILSLPIGTVMSRLARGRIAVGKLFQRDLPDTSADTTSSTSKSKSPA